MDVSAIWRWSIPVHTGKPFPKTSQGFIPRVYPRTHGETERDIGLRTAHRGLSPYTRGNPITGYYPDGQLGSIPVHTGKPYLSVVGLGLLKVYPRTHGETPSESPPCTVRVGLSPYTRGNPSSSASALSRSRSIPVHTGKPWPETRTA